jgi:hypothetical protein
MSKHPLVIYVQRTESILSPETNMMVCHFSPTASKTPKSKEVSHVIPSHPIPQYPYQSEPKSKGDMCPNIDGFQQV